MAALLGFQLIGFGLIALHAVAGVDLRHNVSLPILRTTRRVVGIR